MTFLVESSETATFECSLVAVESSNTSYTLSSEWGPCYGAVAFGDNAIEVKYEGLVTTEWFEFRVRATDKAGNTVVDEVQFVANAIPPIVLNYGWE